LIILCLSIITWTQVGHWQDSITLYDHTLEVTDNSWLIYNNRGNAYKGLGNYRQAIDDYSRAIEISPGYALAYYNRGHAYHDLGNYRQAIEDYGRAIEIKPDYAEAYFNRGADYLTHSDNISGCRDARKACKLGNCKLLEATNTRGLCR